MPSDLESVTVLVPGKLHQHSVDRIGRTFRLVEIERIDPALITDEMKASVRGVAASPAIGGGMIGPEFMAALPNAVSALTRRIPWSMKTPVP